MKPGNLIIQGAKSCGADRKIRPAAEKFRIAQKCLAVSPSAFFFCQKEDKNMANYFFTSESVTGGPPDKICDQISDAVLDAILAEDKNGRVACECCCTTGMVMIMGEITTSAKIDIPSIAHRNAFQTAPPACHNAPFAAPVHPRPRRKASPLGRRTPLNPDTQPTARSSVVPPFHPRQTDGFYCFYYCRFLSLCQVRGYSSSCELFSSNRLTFSVWRFMMMLVVHFVNF